MPHTKFSLQGEWCGDPPGTARPGPSKKLIPHPKMPTLRPNQPRLTWSAASSAASEARSRRRRALWPAASPPSCRQGRGSSAQGGGKAGDQDQAKLRPDMRGEWICSCVPAEVAGAAALHIRAWAAHEQAASKMAQLVGPAPRWLHGGREGGADRSKRERHLPESLSPGKLLFQALCATGCV